MKNKLRNAGLITVLVLACAACSKATDTVIPDDPNAWETQLAPAMKKLDDDQRKLLAGYLLRAKLGQVFGASQGIPPGTTIGKALTEQQAWVADRAKKDAEEAALKDKLQKEREAARAVINQAVTVTLLEKSQIPEDVNVHRFSQQQVFRIAVKNNSPKAIAGVAGSLAFIDIFGKEVGKVSFKITDTIESGRDFVWTGSRDYNQFIDSQRAVWNLEEGKYKTEFRPEAIVFTDGTKVEADAT